MHFLVFLFWVYFIFKTHCNKSKEFLNKCVTRMTLYGYTGLEPHHCVKKFVFSPAKIDPSAKHVHFCRYLIGNVPIPLWQIVNVSGNNALVVRIHIL